jgi:hypothetical protein
MEEINGDLTPFTNQWRSNITIHKDISIHLSVSFQMSNESLEQFKAQQSKIEEALVAHKQRTLQGVRKDAERNRTAELRAQLTGKLAMEGAIQTSSVDPKDFGNAVSANKKQFETSTSTVKTSSVDPKDFGNAVSANKKQFECNPNDPDSKENQNSNVNVAEFGNAVSEGKRLLLQRQAALKAKNKGPVVLTTFQRKNYGQSEGRYAKTKVLNCAVRSPKKLSDLP